MKPIGVIALFSLLFAGSLSLTLIGGRFLSGSLSTESVNKLTIPPSSESAPKILPNSAVNPSSINLLVNPEGKIIGGTSDGSWFKPQDLVPYLKGDEIYRTFSKTNFLGEIQGTVEERTMHAGQLEYTVHWAYPSKFSNQAFILRGGWDPFPRQPQYINVDQEKYYPLVKKVLTRLGLSAPVHISEIIQVDLEGDGNDEILIIADNIDDSVLTHLEHHSLRESYSLIILYQTAEGLGKETVLSGSYRKPTKYSLLFTADVNGDWTMEYLIREVALQTKHSTTLTTITDTLFKLEENHPQKLLEFHFDRILDRK